MDILQGNKVTFKKRKVNIMTAKNKESIKEVLYMMLTVLLLWVVVTNTIQAFKCPKMTPTELLLHLPKTIIGDWQQ